MMRSPVELEMTEGSVDGREHLRCADALIFDKSQFHALNCSLIRRKANT
jgi:hypothetical protein